MVKNKVSQLAQGFAGAIAGLGLLTPLLATAQPARPGLPPLPTGSASAPAGAAGTDSPPPAPSPASSDARPGSSPPPYMVEEPYTPPDLPPAPAPAAPPPGYAPPAYGAPPPVYYGPSPYPGYPGYYAPPPYAYEPPPPPPPAHRAPRTALWVGARAGVIQPFGKLYYDNTSSYTGPSWSDAAGLGGSIELDVGARLGRSYMVYGLWEYAQLGGEDTFRGPGTGSPRASTSLWGIGLRWSWFPDETGLALDLGLGYRTFDLTWSDDTSLHMASPFELRLGIGADIRLSRTFTLSPMFQLTNGAFNDGTYSPAGAPSYSVGGYTATHGTVGLTIGGHFDLLGSQR